MPAEAVRAPELDGLVDAFATFTAATARLEHEYGSLQERVVALTAELEEKNRLLAASAVRERKLEAEALRQSRLAAMGEMAAMLAHEVRNPLGAMELFTGLLLQDLRDRPDALALVRQVASCITDLDHLVSNLLDFTRSRSSSLRAVDCCALVEDALRYTRDLQSSERVVVERSYANPAPQARADPNLLRPVLLNLVRNAVQAMPGGGTLRVSVTRRGSRVITTIGDTGPGISPAEQKRIFRPFYTTRAKGTGLGLAVTRELVGAMQGDLSLRSIVGEGAEFSVGLPLAEETT